MAFKLTDPGLGLKFFFGFCVKFGNPENSDYFCCFCSVLLLFVVGFPNRTHPSIANTRHRVSTRFIPAPTEVFTYYQMSTGWNVCRLNTPK